MSLFHEEKSISSTYSLGVLDGCQSREVGFMRRHTHTYCFAWHCVALRFVSMRCVTWHLQLPAACLAAGCLKALLSHLPPPRFTPSRDSHHAFRLVRHYTYTCTVHVPQAGGEAALAFNFFHRETSDLLARPRSVCALRDGRLTTIRRSVQVHPDGCAR